MTVLRVVLGDQLNLQMSSLADIDKQNDMVLMAEVKSEATYVKHHKKKIAFVFSAMRHFARTLQALSINLTYVKYDASDNQGSLLGQVKHTIQQASVNNTNINKIVITHPAEYRLWQEVLGWSENLGIDVVITEDNRFVASKEDFTQWTAGKKQWRMEFFYREMRKTHGYLLEDGKPVGGKWNYDAENRKKLPKGHTLPKPTVFECDATTQDVLSLVAKEFADHFGSLDGFHYAVTRKQALVVLDEFIEQRLENFGQYQDAMAQNEPWMYHSHIGLYLNTGLLMPHEVLQVAQDAYYQKGYPLNSVEGFIRQILGWREYVRGFYWLLMPNYEQENYLSATRPLPDFFWTAKTDMNCLSQSISQTHEHAYAHHIQRLMVLGNFALLAGLDPKAVNEWYLIVYADAYEWVEMPNVSGMVLFADGGKLASKPYAASGAYINKMSNYCEHCRYSVKEKTGEQACPFNYMYWHFLNRHKNKFAKNPRMAMIYRTMEKMDPTKIEQIVDDGDRFLLSLS